MNRIIGIMVLALALVLVVGQAQAFEDKTGKRTICELMGRIAYDLAKARLDGRPDPHQATADEGAMSYMRPFYDYARAEFYDHANGSPSDAFHLTYMRCLREVDGLMREHQSQQ